MGRNKSQDKAKKKQEKFRQFAKKWAIIYLIITAAFFGLVIYMDMIPAKYLWMSLGVISVITLLIALPMYFKAFVHSRRLIAVGLSILLTFGYLYGGFQIVRTLDFLGSVFSSNNTSVEVFHLVVNEDSLYDEISEIEGATVMANPSKSSNTAELKAKMKNQFNVTFEYVETPDMLETYLIDEQNVLVLMTGYEYDIASEENPDFRGNVKIIETFELELATEATSKKVDIVNESFTVLISGLDTVGSISHVARSDVNMLMTVDPVNKKILLTSVPRDYYIDLAGVAESGEVVKDKLTHTSLYGIDKSISTLENTLGIDINYYAKVNFSTVINLVDAVGGIDVYSDYSFQALGLDKEVFTYYEGMNTLNGAETLAFARERKSFTSGDLQRNKNQQAVLEGMLKKATSSTTILSNYSSILNALEDYVETNCTQEEFSDLVKMQLSDMAAWEIETYSITGETSSEYCYSVGAYASVVLRNEEEEIIALDKIAEILSDGEDLIVED